ncbi:MAG: FAD binding domain-containing protein [Deltaproteobacteria bacterium]|nr:FAD binding domain-containing protein [Deltaproteobacteria bacterium]
MLPFPRLNYEAPGTLDEAARLAAEPGAKILSGGTDLLPSLKHGLFRPSVLVSTRRLEALYQQSPRQLGAGLSLRDVSRVSWVNAEYPALAAACRTVATPTIQGMATLGGNLALDTRCVYYNQPEGWRVALGGCLKCEGTICHVAPRGSGCYAAHSADTVPALWLYGAQVRVHGPGGERSIDVSAMCQSDGRVPPLAPGEIIAGVRLPARPPAVVHRKLRLRAAIDYAQLLVAVSRDDDGYRAVISAVGPRPVAVAGRNVPELVDAAHAAVQPLATHLSAVTWRKKMVRVEVSRAAAALPA